MEAFIGPEEGNGCRRWLGSYDPKGYPRFVPYPGSKFANLVHRMIWQIMWEQEPKRGDIIIRTCGNRWCVSPDHIEKKESHAVYTAA